MSKMTKEKDIEKIPRILILTGFMGSGKTTLGKELASRMERIHVDIDEVIEKETGMTIADIFYKYGEEHFREIENRILEKIVRENEGELIISSGGGTLTFERNWQLVKNEDVLTVYLNEQFETLWERIKNDPKRPLVALNELDESEVKERLLALLEKRQPWYHRADIMIPSPSNRSLDEIMEAILANLIGKENKSK